MIVRKQFQDLPQNVKKYINKDQISNMKVPSTLFMEDRLAVALSCTVPIFFSLLAVLFYLKSSDHKQVPKHKITVINKKVSTHYDTSEDDKLLMDCMNLVSSYDNAFASISNVINDIRYRLSERYLSYKTQFQSKYKLSNDLQTIFDEFHESLNIVLTQLCVFNRYHHGVEYDGDDLYQDYKHAHISGWRVNTKLNLIVNLCFIFFHLPKLYENLSEQSDNITSASQQNPTITLQEIGSLFKTYKDLMPNISSQYSNMDEVYKLTDIACHPNVFLRHTPNTIIPGNNHIESYDKAQQVILNKTKLSQKALVANKFFNGVVQTSSNMCTDILALSGYDAKLRAYSVFLHHGLYALSVKTNLSETKTQIYVKPI